MENKQHSFDLVEVGDEEDASPKRVFQPVTSLPPGSALSGIPQDLDRTFYFRYYVGHISRGGHEFMEFELKPSGLLRYGNSSKHHGNSIIKKQLYVNLCMMQYIRGLVERSKVLQCDDEKWPMPSAATGRQELEIVCGQTHVSFVTAKMHTLDQYQRTEDPEGMVALFYLVGDIKTLMYNLLGMHFKINPYA